MYEEYGVETAEIHVVAKSIYSQLVLCFHLYGKKDVLEFIYEQGNAMTNINRPLCHR